MQKSYAQFGQPSNIFRNSSPNRKRLTLTNARSVALKKRRLTNTRFFEPLPDSRLKNPLTDHEAFGFVPAMEDIEGWTLPVSPIVLPYGRQRGLLSGFGARHIMARHGDVLGTDGCGNVQSVAEFVADALRSGARLYSQGLYGNKLRLCAYRPGIALVVLQHTQTRGKTYWKVITAYRARECDGVCVGSLIPASVHLAS